MKSFPISFIALVCLTTSLALVSCSDEDRARLLSSDTVQEGKRIAEEKWSEWQPHIDKAISATKERLSELSEYEVEDRERLVAALEAELEILESELSELKAEGSSLRDFWAESVKPVLEERDSLARSIENAKLATEETWSSVKSESQERLRALIVKLEALEAKMDDAPAEDEDL